MAGAAGAGELMQLPTTPAGAASPALLARLASGATAAGEPLLSLEALRLFYGARGHRPAWGDDGGVSPQIDILVAALHAADREGLRPADYHTAAIDDWLARLRSAARAARTRPAGAADDLDLLLSDAFFLYATHLTSGRVNPASVEPEWNIAGRARDLVFLLGSALDRGHLSVTLEDLAPVREDYRLLRDALASHRAVAAAGGWPPVPEGAALRPGDRHPRVAALRRRLAATGELPAGGDTAGEFFDAPLADALRRFQSRHGLDPDAVAGRRTIAALNAPAALRARQIEANLERLRWLPRDLGPRRLLVNIADFRLVLTEEGAPTLEMRVIAGRLARRTPFFTGEITSILLNPAWTVPVKIAIEDKLPLILDDRDYFKDHGFRVFAPSGSVWREIDPDDVDWTRVSEKHFPYQLRQDPGPQNALGRIKFQVPNRHDIYLHDTPSRGLFARTERTFSSGCIRVERALDLAVRLLAGDPTWTRERIEKTIATGDTVSVPLPAPMPVYLLYWTAWVDRDGLLQFREDVYGRDDATLEALGKPLASPKPDGRGHDSSGGRSSR
jgi:murein L,D-transpeptidase YcbB/YkuD